MVKELVENSLDAGAASIEVRFKGHGLDLIEVQDNGNGVAPEDFETIALKHYTSKLSSYDDLTSLQTFGFRGEALSSLCALSNFHITTARAAEAPRGTRLDFELSGKLKEKSIIASQRGTTVAVEGIFKNLPVRRKELERNIKREYGKALGLLQAYACISTGVRFSVSNQPSKGVKAVAFSTKANPTTKENISNVYGAKTILALLQLDLELEMQPTVGPRMPGVTTSSAQDDAMPKTVKIEGHISRPVIGEGRQTPDRQMFFVNSRPCALPQVSKAFNEVYKSYNVTQSPFIFANLILDTTAYDVNVSPDKRTILLHDQTALLDSIKASLTDVFDKHDQSVPQASASTKSLPEYKSLNVDRNRYNEAAKTPLIIGGRAEVEDETDTSITQDSQMNGLPTSNHLIRNSAERNVQDRGHQSHHDTTTNQQTSRAPDRVMQLEDEEKEKEPNPEGTGFTTALELTKDESWPSNKPPGPSQVVRDFQARMANQRQTVQVDEGDQTSSDEPLEVEQPISAVHTASQKPAPGPVPNAFDRMRPKRVLEDTVTVTVGDQTTRMTFGTPPKVRRMHTPRNGSDGTKLHASSQAFGKSLQTFNAPGTQMKEPSEDIETESEAEQDAASEEMSDASPDNDEDEVAPPLTRKDSPLFVQEGESSEDEYIDEEEKKQREEARVAKMIAEAEEAAAKPSQDNIKRATQALKGRVRKDSTLQLIHNLGTSVSKIEKSLTKLTTALQDQAAKQDSKHQNLDLEPAAKSAEERLSLTVSKSDFDQMRIVGQFNLGFILALRPARNEGGHSSDELFIVDQHAADEKYNFERLSTNTIVQNQRLVHPKLLELTAVEEETVLEHSDVLAQNGFQLDVDTSGEAPVGRRCKVVSLPMSKEVTFTIRDLEELIALLNEGSTDDTTMASESVVRPSKVRKMLAMRACRSSIMVGRNLTNNQMTKVVRHMGEMDKPWNCPHGRPTMRHLFSMEGWQDGWLEGQGVTGLGPGGVTTDWKGYLRDSQV